MSLTRRQLSAELQEINRFPEHSKDNSETGCGTYCSLQQNCFARNVVILTGTQVVSSLRLLGCVLEIFNVLVKSLFGKSRCFTGFVLYFYLSKM